MVSFNIVPGLYNNAIITNRNLALKKKLIETWKYLNNLGVPHFSSLGAQKRLQAINN
jgi:hypothetical protein